MACATNKNLHNDSPPKKKSRISKMNNARESLGEFDSSIFDASDGHKLVELIRKKKGVHVQTQKIFDDVPKQRPSLQIEIIRLDKNEKTLPPQEPTLAINTSNNVLNPAAPLPTNTQFVPKSPRRISTTKPIPSPIIKMNSTTLGRRTLLKEFEKAFLQESRFLPQICSTPLTTELSNQVQQVDETYAPKNIDVEQNIICTPITISDDGSPVEGNKTLTEKCNSEKMLHALVKQNDMLSALVQSDKDRQDILTNKENPLPKSPRRTFTIERDISSGKIILSPVKCGQNVNRNHPLLPKIPIKSSPKQKKNFIVTPEQRSVLNRLGLTLATDSSPQKVAESVQKTSGLPTFSKTNTVSSPCLIDQETTSGEFFENLQKNAPPNFPMIVIPVNQTFNQSPSKCTTIRNASPERSLGADEITSIICNNAPQMSDLVPINVHTEETNKKDRIYSTASNCIPPTTISNVEPVTGESTRPTTLNLRWDDINTDDESSPDRIETRKSHLENKTSNKFVNKEKHHSTLDDKRKLSLSNKCLDLRVRVRRDENKNNLPQRSPPVTSKVDKYLQVNHDKDLSHRSRVKASKNDDKCNKKLSVQNLAQRSRLDSFKADERCTEELQNNLQQRCRRDSSEIEQQLNADRVNIMHVTSDTDEQSDEYGEHISRQQFRRNALKADDERYANREKNNPQKSRRGSSYIDNQNDYEERLQKEAEINLKQQFRHDKSKFDEQSNEDRQNNLTQKSRCITSNVDKQLHGKSKKTLSHRSLGEASKNNEKCNTECENNLGQRSRRDAPTTDERCLERHTYNLPQLSSAINEESDEDDYSRYRYASRADERHAEERVQKLHQRSPQKSSNIEEQRKADRVSNLPQRSRRDTYKIDKHYGTNLPQKSRRATSNIDEQSDEDREYNLQQRLQRDKSNSDLSGEERENTLPQISRPVTSKVDKYLHKKHEKPPSHRSHKEASNNDDQYDKKRVKNSAHRSRWDASKSDERCAEGHEQNLHQRSRWDSSEFENQRNANRVKNLPQRSGRDTYKIHRKRDSEQENNLPQISRSITSNIDEQSDDDRMNDMEQGTRRDTSEDGDRLPKERSRRDKSRSDLRCGEELENNLPQKTRPVHSNVDKYLHENHAKDPSYRSQGEASKNDDKSDRKRVKNLAHRSRGDASLADEAREKNLHQRSCRAASEFEEQRIADGVYNLPQRSGRDTYMIDEERDTDRENNLPQMSRCVSSNIDKHPLSLRDVSKIVEQRNADRVNNFPQRSRRDRNKIDKARGSERGNKLPQKSKRATSNIDEHSDEDSIHNLQQRSQLDTSESDEGLDKEPEIKRIQRSRRDKFKFDEQCDKDLEKYLTQRSRQDATKADKIFDEERENSLAQKSRRVTSKISNQPHEKCEQNLSHRSRKETSKYDKQCEKDLKKNLPHRSQKDNVEIDEQSDTGSETNLRHTSRPHTSQNDEQLDEENEAYLAQRPQRGTEEFNDERVEEHDISTVEKKRDKDDEKIDPLRRSIGVKNNEIEILQIEVLPPPPPEEFRDTDLNLYNISKSFEKDQLVGELSSDKLSLEMFQRPANVKQKSKRKKSKIPDNVKQYLEVDKKVKKTKYLNVSKRKLYCKGNSDMDSLDDSTPNKTYKRILSYSNTSTHSSIAVSPSKSNSSQSTSFRELSSQKTHKSRVSSTTKNLTNEGRRRNSLSLHSNNRQLSASPSNIGNASDVGEKNPANSSKSNLNRKKSVSKKTEKARKDNEKSKSKDKAIACEKNHRSRSPQKISTHVSDIKKKSGSSNDRVVVENNNHDVERNKEEDVLEPASISHSQPRKTSANPSKKTETTKQKNNLKKTAESESSTASIDDNCGLRRSKRERKQPGAYWASGTEFTHVYDIVTMFAAGKKLLYPEYRKKPVTNKKELTKKLPSTDDNLVANTNSVQSSSDKNKKRTKHKSKKNPENACELETNPTTSEVITSSANSSDYASENNAFSVQTHLNPKVVQTSKDPVDAFSKGVRLSGDLMPPPLTNVIKKGNKSHKNKAYRTEHDAAIADVSSIDVNNLFDQLKDSSMSSSMASGSRQKTDSSGQASLDNHSSRQRNTFNSLGKVKNVSVRLQRMNLREGSYDVNERVCDSGFSSDNMNSVNPKKDVLLDWLMQMVHRGKTSSNTKQGLAKLLTPNGYNTAKADDIVFEDHDGVNFAFYKSEHVGQKFGYLRFQPGAQKKMSCTKITELNFVLLAGQIQMTVNDQTFEMKNGDLTTIFIGATYCMKNLSDDPALAMVIKNN